ncbi:MAG: DUF58 domain-containing protein [Thermoleophilia bacterium]
MATVAPPPDAAGARRAGAASEALLRRVEFRIAHRLDHVLQGERLGRRPGPGGEPSVTRVYEPGDDVRWIDWPLTARTRQPMVRVPEMEPVLTAWTLVDCSPSMRFGSGTQTKLDVAMEALAGLAVVLRRRGDRLGVAATRSGELDLVVPPRGDRRGLVGSLAMVSSLPAPTAPGRTDLVAAVAAMGRVARHRGAIVVISDLPPSDALEQALGSLARRHELIVVEVRDPRERELPNLGTVRLRDMETGGTRLVDTADPRFQRRFAEVTAERDARRAGLLARVGARHVVVGTDQDWVLPMARALAGAGRRRWI